MKRFYYIQDVERAEGWQRSYIEAETLEEAKKGYLDRTLEHHFEDESIEVTSLGDPQWEDDD